MKSCSISILSTAVILLQLQYRKRCFLAITYEYAQSSLQTLDTLSKNIKENQTCSAMKNIFKALAEATATSITVLCTYEIGGDAP